jgi:hypothetical protein
MVELMAIMAILSWFTIQMSITITITPGILLIPYHIIMPTAIIILATGRAKAVETEQARVAVPNRAPAM